MVKIPSSVSQISACNLLTDSSATGKSQVRSRPMVNFRIMSMNGYYIQADQVNWRWGWKLLVIN